VNMGFMPDEWPEFRLQIDPNDFMVPQVFNPNDTRWAKTGEQIRRVASQCH
jgi:hypothetical protein